MRIGAGSCRPSEPVETADLSRFADTFSDLADPDVMGQAWR
jgi:hypothetical protein